MKGTKAASRYAKALLELAIENNQVDAVLNDMEYLSVIAKEHRDFQLLVQSPIINSEKKIKIFDELFGQFQQISRMFIELITKKEEKYFFWKLQILLKRKSINIKESLR